MDENPYQSLQSPLIVQPTADISWTRWRKIVSNSIFVGLFLTSMGWTWDEDRFWIAIAVLLAALLIRFWPVSKSLKS
jgi:hypothetical protein